MLVLAAALSALVAGCASRCPGARATEQPGASTAGGGAGGVEVVEAGSATVLVAIDRDGRTWIDGQPVASDDELAQRLGARGAGGSVTLQADARVPHGRVLGVIDRLRAAGVTRVAFAASAASAASAAAPPPPAEPEPAAPSPASTAEAPAEPAAPAGEPGAGALPQVIVENVGLHIGGGPNDDATKAPFQQAIAQHFAAFRACYVKAEQPEKGGTFGVDLFIRRDGGKPDVRQPRTGMRGTEFRQCVVRAFEQVEFAKPPRGPTVISYSLRFKLED